jgi:hypothetical protein
LQSLIQRDQLVAALDQQVLPELVAAEHLEHQPAEISEPFLAHAQERATLAPELSGVRQ